MSNSIQVFRVLQISKPQSLISPVENKIELKLKKGVHFSNIQNVQEVNLQNNFRLVGGNVIFIQSRSRVILKIGLFNEKFITIKLVRSIAAIMFAITPATKNSKYKCHIN